MQLRLQKQRKLLCNLNITLRDYAVIYSRFVINNCSQLHAAFKKEKENRRI